MRQPALASLARRVFRKLRWPGQPRVYTARTHPLADDAFGLAEPWRGRYWVFTSNPAGRPYQRRTVLSVLAHELAHREYAYHCGGFSRLQRRLYGILRRMVRRGS